jgi:ABC-type polar amino acid transport system ATPase subunit
MDRVTTYNSDGKKIDEIEYNISGQKWRKRYEYDQNGMVFREFVYNEKNVLDNYKRFEYNEFGKKKTQYTYDAKGKLKTIKVFEYITQDAGE